MKRFCQHSFAYRTKRNNAIFHLSISKDETGHGCSTQCIFVSVVLVKHNAKEFIGFSPSSYQFRSLLDESPQNKWQKLKSFNEKMLFHRDLQMIEEQKLDKYERSHPSDIVNTFDRLSNHVECLSSRSQCTSAVE